MRVVKSARRSDEAAREPQTERATLAVPARFPDPRVALRGAAGLRLMLLVVFVRSSVLGTVQTERARHFLSPRATYA
jgi:hypothetical protein